jgi:PE family
MCHIARGEKGTDMSFVSAAPEMMTSAAADLATIGSDLSAAHTAAAASTVVVMPAAADEVSAAISAVFGSYAQGYQALADRAAAFHDQFGQTLRAGAASYVSAEATNVFRTVLHEIIFLQPVIQGVQSATQSVIQSLEFFGQGLVLLGQPLGPNGQGLVMLGQSLETLAQDLQNLPISGGQP